MLIITYVSMPSTLHFFLNVYIAQGPWMVVTALHVYLTSLTALNVYLIGMLQYIFLLFFYTMFSVVNMGDIVLHRHCFHLVHWLMLSCWFSGCFLLLFDSTLKS
jgi:hypothetical protein